MRGVIGHVTGRLARRRERCRSGEADSTRASALGRETGTGAPRSKETRPAVSRCSKTQSARASIAPPSVPSLSVPTWPCCSGSSRRRAVSSSACAHDCSMPRPVLTTLGSATASAMRTFCASLGIVAVQRKILDAYLNYMADRPRLGFLGFGIGDVEALALLGRARRGARPPARSGRRRLAVAVARPRLDPRRRSVSRRACATTPAFAPSWPRSMPTSPGCASALRRPRRAATGSRCSRSPRTARDASRQPRTIDAAPTYRSASRTRNARPV